MKLDKIMIKNIEVFAFHGALPEENRLGQRFYIDVTLFKDLRKACKNDNLKETVHYGLVHDEIISIAKSNTYYLIEKLAEEISEKTIKKFDVEKIIVKIKKPNAPINGHFEYVAVGIERTADEYR